MSLNTRINFLFAFFLISGLLVAGRLFYWQILASPELSAAAEGQHWVSFEIPARRGEILARDGFPLVTNEEAFLVFASLPDLKDKPEKIAAQIAPFLEKKEILLETEQMLKAQLKRQDLVWVPLKHRLSRETKKNLESLQIEGLGFEEEPKRSYPEGSGSAHLLGFVGLDINGRDKGYFGLEGYYELELKGRSGFLRREKDASGRPILVGEAEGEEQKDGRSLVTTIDRTVQFIIEKELRNGLKRFGALSGTVVVAEPSTGAILGMVSLPGYDSARYFVFDKKLYPNPVVASSYEPGSAFKVLVMAAALNEEVVKPETRCEQCSGPRRIADYTIQTWNDEYHPQSTMVEVIEHSDNVGMIFVAEKLGIEKTVDYLSKFGLGQPTGIDLEDEASPPLRPVKEWRLIDLATAAFGQGVAITPIQMVKAVGAIANQGKLMKPFVVQKVVSNQEVMEIQPQFESQIIKPATARLMTEIMVNAVENGEAKWAKPKGFRIAGKTGTAQIPVAGHYDKEKTIASFVGFAPADKPQFLMLVTLREPSSSPWGSETAAPLWFDIAKQFFTYYGIQPG